MSPSLPLMTLAQAQALIPGSTLIGDGLTPIGRVHSDSRSLQPGDLFVALRGEHFDAHDFLAQAHGAGAAAALAERGLAEAGLAGLRVSDSLQALQTLAGAWRARFTLPLIAVTGSNGKTTVTQMLAAILSEAAGDAALVTAGNLNNHIGTPLMLLRLRPQHRIAALELGMNHTGEIALLASLAAPTVGLVNNAQREHQEFMAGVQAVARENGAVIEALPADGVAVFPAHDEHSALWRGLAGARRTLSFGMGGDVWAEAAWLASHWHLSLHTPQGVVGVALQAPGAHSLHNAQAAAAAALAAGVPLVAVAAGLDKFRPVAGRSQVRALQRDDGTLLTLVDDSYNANPDSVRAAIDLLASLPAPRGLLLGDMGEVGAQGPSFHDEVGAHARLQGIELFWTVGELSIHAARAFGPSARHFAQVADLQAALPQALRCASVLVKGSRFMRMERVVQALVQSSTAGAAQAQPAASVVEAGHVA